MWLEQHVKPSEEITYDQMLRYYREHQAEFTKRARASWEELMVSFAKYPNEDAAYAAICRLGNEVLAGRPFADVARAGSDGVTANNGGRRNWTSSRKPGVQGVGRGVVQPARRPAQPDHQGPERLSHHPRDGPRGRRGDAVPSGPSRDQGKNRSAADEEADAGLHGRAHGKDADMDDL